VGARTFVRRDGRWTDTRALDTLRKVTVKPFSPAYFSLIEQISELKSIFALGDKVTTGGRRVAIVLDEQGAERLSAADLAAVARDW
jgi:hypothetical protein